MDTATALLTTSAFLLNRAIKQAYSQQQQEDHKEDVNHPHEAQYDMLSM